MTKKVYIFSVILISACSNAQEKEKFDESDSRDSLKVDTLVVSDESLRILELDTLSCGLNFKPGENYKAEKYEINKIREELKTIYLNASDIIARSKITDSAGETFTDFLLNSIIPYWYGTVWDFNGYTSVPNQGTIACGYFVSTTMRDMGLDLNRYKLAQQGPENEAKSVAVNLNEVRYLNNKNLFRKLKNLDEGLYFVGLDNHVGYLYIKEDIVYFIHSNYIDGKVMVENAEYSEAFFSINYYISSITGNKSLMEKWLNNDQVKVIED